MNPKIIIGLVILNLFVVLGVVNGAIFKKQAIVDSGKTVFLELAPVDPRSLMQGDYMILNFALSRDKDFKEAAEDFPTRGKVVLKLSDDNIATFSRVDNSSGEPAKNEILLNYRKWRRGFKFGIESFFFEEGSAEKYEEAKFAELRVSENGEPVLLDLHKIVPPGN